MSKLLTYSVNLLKWQNYFFIAISAFFFVSTIANTNAQERGISTVLPNIKLSPIAPDIKILNSLSTQETEQPNQLKKIEGDWTLVDSVRLTGTVPAGKRLIVRFDNAAHKLVFVGDSIVPKDALPAIAASPKWLRAELADNLRRLSYTVRTGCESAILAANDSIRDEVAFEVAHLSPHTLSGMNLNILTINAQGIYKVAPDLAYVKLVEYGNPATGDWYTTTSYHVVLDGVTTWLEIPKEIYYWWVMMPKIDDEDPIMDASVYNQFWRDHLYTNADNSYPILHDALQGVKILWDGNTHVWQNQDTAKNPYPFSDTMSAIQAVGQWCQHQLPVLAQDPRPIQPNQILHHHYGNCGELQDLVDAGARTALIPVQPTETFPGDHTYTELYFNGIWNYWDVWRDGGPTLIHNCKDSKPNEMAFYKKACISGWRGDGLQIPVNDHYADIFTLTVKAIDATGKPIDGAEIFFGAATETDPHGTNNYYYGTWGHTGANGTYTIELSDSINYLIRGDWMSGSDPADINNFYSIPYTTAAKGAQIFATINLPGNVPSLPAVSTVPTGTTGAYKVVLSGSVPYQTVYGGKFWQGAFDLDNQDYSENINNGTISLIACTQSEFDNYNSKSPFNAYIQQNNYGGGDKEFSLPKWTDSYIILSNEGLVHNSSTVDLTAYLYVNPLLGVEAGSGELVLSSFDVPSFASSFPVRGNLKIGNSDEGTVVLEVYDIFGNRVETILNNSMNPGSHSFVWNGSNPLTNGLYFLVLRTSHTSSVKKVMIVR
jgi:hypothetical protein